MCGFDVSVLMHAAMVELAATPLITQLPPRAVLAPPRVVADWDLHTLVARDTHAVAAQLPFVVNATVHGIVS